MNSHRTLVVTAATLLAATILSSIVTAPVLADNNTAKRDTVIVVVPTAPVVIYQDQYGNRIKPPKRDKKHNDSFPIIDPMEHVGLQANGLSYDRVDRERSGGLGLQLGGLVTKDGLQALTIGVAAGRFHSEASSQFRSNIPVGTGGYVVTNVGQQYGNGFLGSNAAVPVTFWSDQNFTTPVGITIYSSPEKSAILGQILVVGHCVQQTLILPAGHWWIVQEGTGGNWIDFPCGQPKTIKVGTS